MRLVTGQVAVTGTAQALTTTQYETANLELKLPSTAAQPVFYGAAGVTISTGHILEPGSSLKVNDENQSGEPVFDLDPQELFVVGTPGDTVTWAAWVR